MGSRGVRSPWVASVAPSRLPSSIRVLGRSETQFKVMLSKTKLFGALAFSMQAKAMHVGPYTHEV